MDIREAVRELATLRYFFLPESATVIIPCLNEEDTIGSIISECKGSPMMVEVIVVDDGSTDSSAKIARQCGAKVIRHKKNMGKGAAIISGAKAASNEVLVFIDGDIQNFSSDIVERLALPVIKKEAKMCKATFQREGGRVTELTAKPLLEMLFPEMTLTQPLSGQFAIRKDALLTMEISNDWGIDIGIALSHLKAEERIVEVNIGHLEHKHRSLESLAKTARDVTRTILQNAGFLANKHKIVIFDFDRTLVAESSIFTISRQLGTYEVLERSRKEYFAGKIREAEITKRLAAALKGIKVDEFRKAARKVKKQQFCDETLAYLKRMGYKIGCISYAYENAINAIIGQNKIDIIVAPRLKVKKGRFTGEVAIPRFMDETRVFDKGKACRHMLKKLRIAPNEAIAIGDSESDQGMFGCVGLSASIGGKKMPGASMRIKSLPEVLIIAN